MQDARIVRTRDGGQELVRCRQERLQLLRELTLALTGQMGHPICDPAEYVGE
jgi:hypothetical protein